MPLNESDTGEHHGVHVSVTMSAAWRTVPLSTYGGDDVFCELVERVRRAPIPRAWHFGRSPSPLLRAGLPSSGTRMHRMDSQTAFEASAVPLVERLDNPRRI